MVHMDRGHVFVWDHAGVRLQVVVLAETMDNPPAASWTGRIAMGSMGLYFPVGDEHDEHPRRGRRRLDSACCEGARLRNFDFMSAMYHRASSESRGRILGFRDDRDLEQADCTHPAELTNL